MSERSGHILIVDDTPENIQVLGGMLRDGGYDVNAASSGQAALDSLDRVAPDLVLLDVIMPDMDGFEVCKRLKANAATAEIPVIFLTAKVETEDVVRGFELGAVDYVTKPFRSAELLERVGTHVTMNRLRRELAVRVDELSSALGQIERLHREQDAFLRHELNNVINPIAGYTDLLRTQLADQLDERQLGWLGAIESGASSMKSMLDEMKKLQDIERGVHQLEVREVTLQDLLKDVVRDVSVSHQDLVTITLSGEGLGSSIMADVRFLPGVFKNLIKNAAEHVAGLGESERRVDVVCEPAGESVLIRVQNGVVPLTAERLVTFFDKFNSTKSGQEGTGLGTSYARLVTLAHGGSIGVTSDSDTGIVVSVLLPLA